MTIEGDMTYAPAHRPFDDADSHITEFPDFLRDHAGSFLRIFPDPRVH